MTTTKIIAASAAYAAAYAAYAAYAYSEIPTDRNYSQSKQNFK